VYAAYQWENVNSITAMETPMECIHMIIGTMSVQEFGNVLVTIASSPTIPRSDD
jgi:hypothetical protein